MRFTLMNKDVPVLDFVYDENQHAVLSVCAEHDLTRAPLAVWNERVARFATWDTLASLVGRWWSRRSIPQSRINLKTARRLAGFDDPVQLTAATCGFSLSDQYWARPEGSNLTWRQSNFFTNRFDVGLGRILAGIQEIPGETSPVSPSATVDGNLPKMWRVGDNGVRELLKAGSGPLRQEPFNEVVATRLYERVLTPGDYVSYRREAHGAGQYSVCPCFVDENCEFVSARDVYWSLPGNDSSPTLPALVAAAEALGVPHMRNRLNELLACDYVLGNADRHLGNFGALRKAEGGPFVACAPVFDSGLSLLCLNGDQNQSALNILANPFLPQQSQQLALVSDLSWLDPKALDGFADEAANELAACPSRYMDAERIAYLRAFVESGVRVLFQAGSWEALDPNDIAAVEERAHAIDALRARFLVEMGFGATFIVVP